MNINRNSRLVYWAYYFTNKCDVPHVTTLCAFFWRAFFWVPLAWLLIIGVASFVVTAMAVFFWEDPLKFLGVTAGLFGIIVAVIVIAWLSDQSWHDITPTVSKESTFVQGVKAIKNKFCPLIYLVEHQHD